MKTPSLFSKMLKTVSNLPWLKGIPLHQDNNKLDEVSFAEFTQSLKTLTDEEFDKLVRKIFKQRGYAIVENEDPNIDLVLQENQITTYVQYKQWRKDSIDIDEVEAFYLMMQENNIRYGIVLSAGLFTLEALEFSLGKTLMLINGIDFSQMIDILMSSDSEAEEENKIEEQPVMPELEPLCPICSQQMIKRTARKGKNAGNTFWGCSTFPNCRGVVSNS
ncbi:MAG: restriction endonuclease [Woeseiaceae bacterium]